MKGLWSVLSVLFVLLGVSIAAATPLDVAPECAPCANGQCYRAPVARAAVAVVRVVRPVPAIAKTVEVRTAFGPGPVYVNERRRTRLQQPRFAVRLFSRFGRR